MMFPTRSRLAVALVFVLLLSASMPARAVASPQTQAPTLASLISAVRAKSKSLESSPGMRAAYDSFLAAHHLAPGGVSYSDFILVRLTFEATRDAGFWNMHWSITDQPPNSDRIWAQWKTVTQPSFTQKTATAECDELSALFAFLVERSGVKGVGLFWPYPNHTVAIWSFHTTNSAVIRVVVPTSQIFLTENDTFDTRKFDPWHQKTIYDYTRRDAPDSFVLPKPLYDFFLSQMNKYAGASTDALQQIRNLRDAVFQKTLTPDQAAREALRRRAAFSSSTEDQTAFDHFINDFRSSSN
jgi:hypothetical protein